MSDRVGLMQNGDLVQVATPAEVYHQPATRFAAGFVGASNSLTCVVTEPARAGTTWRYPVWARAASTGPVRFRPTGTSR
ncbi:hypothetical protein GS498_20780 [Rhodococcus hoagii]|nr:hypothetical protein [Prescottella equi]